MCPHNKNGLDLTKVNLYRDIDIFEKGVGVYEEDQMKEQYHTKPKVGDKLNVTALITINRVPPR
jgi:hypothetical protein